MCQEGRKKTGQQTMKRTSEWWKGLGVGTEAQQVGKEKVTSGPVGHSTDINISVW